MDVGSSIEEGHVGMNNSKEEVKKDEGGALMEMIGKLKKNEEMWRSKRVRVDKALVAAQTAARQDQEGLHAAFRNLVDVITSADVQEFISAIEKLVHQTDMSAIFNFREPSGRSLLHIAAGVNEDDILQLLLYYVTDDLIIAQDDWGDTPLHVAVKARGYRAAETLIRRATELPFNVKNHVLTRRNKHGNTPLHEAMLNDHFRLVIYLLKEDLRSVYWMNVDHKSPLYLALDTSNNLKYTVFLKYPLEPSSIQGLSPVHGAILCSDYGLVKKILKSNMELFAKTDSSNGNVFHLAAYMNKPQVFELIQRETEKLAQDQDMNGDLSIHIASKMGHVDLIQKLHPVSQLLNRQDQTVFHVAAKYGRSSAVRYLLRHPDLGKLINKRDGAGNTPLHLAAMHSQPAVLIHLVLDERIKPFLLNYKRLTAIDIALNRVREEPTFRKVLAFTVLESASVVSRDLILQKPEARDKEFPRSGVHMNLTKEVINSRLLVAALVATVTFTAGFAIPGGFNGSDTTSKDRGMATMVDKRMFQAFTICNTIAMFCSMIAVIILMMAQQSDLHKAITAFQRTILPLAIALPAMSGAFLTGVSLTVGKLPWLAHTIFCLGSVGLLIVSGATLLEYPYFYRGHCRPIRILTSWLVLAYIYLWGVETNIADDREDDGLQELH